MIRYSGAERYSLDDGRPVAMTFEGKTTSLKGNNVIQAVSHFVDALGTGGPASHALSLSMDIEVLVGSASMFVHRLEQALASMGTLAAENRELRRQLDELAAELALLRTQIPSPNAKKVHWTASSLMLSLVAISALLQGSAAVRAHFEPDEERVVAEELNRSIEQCEVVVNYTEVTTWVAQD